MNTFNQRTSVVRLLWAVLLLCTGLVGCWGPHKDRPRARKLLAEATRWYTGSAGKIDESRAADLFKEAAQYGGPLATMWTAKLMLNGDCEWTEDRERAQALATNVLEDVRVLAERGEVEAAFLLGDAYDNGLGVSRNPTEAHRWLLRAAEQGHLVAQLTLAKLLWYGDGIQQDQQEALRWFRAAADRGDAWAQFYLGVAHYSGTGVPEDRVAAASWYRRASNRGLAAAQCGLALAYWEAQGVDRNMAEAQRLMRLAAGQGNPDAQRTLGDWYATGEGVAQDQAEAIKWYLLAAAQDDVIAQRYLGQRYESGFGVNQDHYEAVKWFRSAADLGDAVSQYFLSVAYTSGKGVPQNYVEGLRWLRQAANGGSFVAQVSLAGAYLYGRAPAEHQDMELAYVYTSLATANPEKSTAGRESEGMIEVLAAFRNLFGATLTGEQIARAQATAAAIQNEIEDRQRFGGARKRDDAFTTTERAPDITGSGVVVAGGSSFLTNAHVVNDCREIRAVVGESRAEGKVIAIDSPNDLAVVALIPPVEGEVRFRGPKQLRLGEEVIVVGFPLQGLLTSTPQLTTGIISSLAGPGDDSRIIQISAALQPGNSGGPVLDRSGNLIGLAVGKLDTVLVAKATGSIPENVGFAIRSEIVAAFLTGQGVKFRTARSTTDREVPEIGEQARSYAVRVECWKQASR